MVSNPTGFVYISQSWITSLLFSDSISHRAFWSQNETEYLQQQRQKVGANAFFKLKTIGHGWFFTHLT